MFIQYRKEKIPFHAEGQKCSGVCRRKDGIQIVYPSRDHATIVTGQDFYVIGTFDRKVMDPFARLQVLLSDSSGRVIRRVECSRMDDKGSIRADFEGIESEETKEAIRESGMPDLVYDPERPESFYYTWNKAYYTEKTFAALIYGGTYGKERIFQKDQNGEPISPLEAGIYTVTVTLTAHSGQENGETADKAGEAAEVWSASIQIRIADHTKAIVLSRFTSPKHLEQVEKYAFSRGFEKFTDPYPGIWDTEYFACQWQKKVHIEIPERWHWADAREYLTGEVYFFDYMISEKCISYEVEIGSLLDQDQGAFDRAYIHTLYYSPQREILEFLPGRYLAVTGIRTAPEGDKNRLRLSLVSKPVPSGAQRIRGCHFRPERRITTIRVSAYDRKGDLVISKEMDAGRYHVTPQGTREWILMETEAEATVDPEKDICEISAEGYDQDGVFCDRITELVDSQMDRK